jgi:hypothetical protein
VGACRKFYQVFGKWTAIGKKLNSPGAPTVAERIQLSFGEPGAHPDIPMISHGQGREADEKTITCGANASGAF